MTKANLLLSWGRQVRGKTTLLNCISCYIPFERGNIKLGDITLAKLDENSLAKVRNQKLGFVFQDFMLLDGLSVKENIMLPRIISGRTGGDMETSADRLCEVFGIAHIKDKYPRLKYQAGEKRVLPWQGAYKQSAAYTCR